MPKVTINFASGAPLTVDDVPDGTTDIQIANRIRDKFPAREIKSIQGVQPASLGDRLKDFATTGQKQIFGKDLPQLALGAADTLTLGRTSDINPAQSPDEKSSRNAGREIPAVLPTRMVPSLSGRSMVPPTPANLGRLLKAAQAAKAAQAPAAAAAPGVAKGINPAILRTLLHGAGIGAGPSALAYELYKHFFP